MNHTVESALQFGAGNIGRGFMGQLFFETGYHTIFVDSDTKLVERINGRKRYVLRLLDAYSKRERDLRIANISALSTLQTSDIAASFAAARTAATAVGVENLKSIAPLIAAGIAERYRSDGGPIDIYLCENLYGAYQILHDEVMRLLEPGPKRWAQSNVGFVGTVVARMVPQPRKNRTGADPLLVLADSYHTLPFDGAATKAPPLPVEGMYPAASFRAEVERKLFTHNLGHAILGYIGYLKGLHYVHEAIADPYIADVFSNALEESAQALVAKYPQDIDSANHREVLADVYVRFGNPMIMDTVQRVARDPIRKLGPDDRMIGAAKLCIEQKVTPQAIALACSAALCYDYEGDAAAVKLQKTIKKLGVEKTFAGISGVRPSSAFGKAVRRGYDELQKLRAVRHEE